MDNDLTGGAIASLLASLKEDPAKMAQLGAMLGSLGLGSSPSPPPEGEEGGKEETASSPLASLLSNPAMLARLPAMLDMLRPMLNQLSSSPAAGDSSTDESPRTPAEEAAGTEAPAATVSAPISSPSPSMPAHRPLSRDAKQRVALLLALKPYLNSSRCEMIDSIVGLSRLGEMLLPRDP